MLGGDGFGYRTPVPSAVLCNQPFFEGGSRPSAQTHHRRVYLGLTRAAARRPYTAHTCDVWGTARTARMGHRLGRAGSVAARDCGCVVAYSTADCALSWNSNANALLAFRHERRGAPSCRRRLGRRLAWGSSLSLAVVGPRTSASCHIQARTNCGLVSHAGTDESQLIQ